MSELNIISATQHIIVDMASGSVSVIQAGPQGPGGPMGEVSTGQMDAAIDLALDIRGLPPGGLAGQVLGKLSDRDYDYGWVTPA